MIGRGKEKGKLLRFLAGKGKAFLVHELCSLRTVWMLVKKDFPEIRDNLWKEYFWSRSYCLITAGGAPLEILKEYIRTQGEDYDGRKG